MQGKYHDEGGCYVLLVSFFILCDCDGGYPRPQQYHVHVQCGKAGISEIFSVQSGDLGRLFGRHAGLYPVLQSAVGSHSKDQTAHAGDRRALYAAVGMEDSEKLFSH